MTRTIEVEQLAKVRLEPGDTLILKLAGRVNAEVLSSVSESLRDAYPDTRIKFLLLGEDASVEVLKETAA